MVKLAREEGKKLIEEDMSKIKQEIEAESQEII